MCVRLCVYWPEGKRELVLLSAVILTHVAQFPDKMRQKCQNSHYTPHHFHLIWDCVETVLLSAQIHFAVGANIGDW